MPLAEERIWEYHSHSYQWAVEVEEETGTTKAAEIEPDDETMDPLRRDLNEEDLSRGRRWTAATHYVPKPPDVRVLDLRQLRHPFALQPTHRRHPRIPDLDFEVEVVNVEDVPEGP